MITKVATEQWSKEDAERAWNKLEAACHLISQKQTNKLMYQDLYDIAYRLTFHQYGKFAYEQMKRTIEDIVEKIVTSTLNIHQQDEQLINDFIKAHEDCNYFQKQTSGVCLYMEKNFICQKKLDTIRTLVFQAFKSQCFERDISLSNKIINSLLTLIRLDRNGVKIERFKLREALQILIDINSKQKINDSKSYNSSNVDYEVSEEHYKFHFERKFLKETTQYYQEICKAASKTGTVEFVIELEDRFKEEQKRIQQFIPTSHQENPNANQDKVIECFIKIIGCYSNQICGGLVEFIDSGKIDIVQRVFWLLSKSPDGLEAFQQTLVHHVTSKGSELLQQPNEQTLEAIIGLHNQITNIISNLQGTKDQRFKLQSQIKNAFIAMLNRDSSIIHELNRYFDKLLKKDGFENNRNAIDQGMIIFNLIVNKDLFELTYRRLLCFRLLDSTVACLDQEQEMVKKFKIECGTQLTQKMEVMFTDLLCSKQESRDFRQYLDQRFPEHPEIEISVLSQGQWPLSEPPSMLIHDELAHFKGEFEKHYLQKNQKRKLEWNHNLGFVSLKACYEGTKKEFICSPLQATILLHFNRQRKYSYADLLAMTMTEESTLTNEVDLLVNLKLLIWDGGQLQLNMGYQHRYSKIKIIPKKTPALLSGRKKIDEVLDREVIIDRKTYLESLIVRKMKIKKRLDHKDLLRDIDGDTKNKLFSIDTNLFKECIASLIQKDYLVRQEGQPEVYIYKA